MPKLIPSKFQEYEFTKEEVIQAKILSPLTKMYLENELAVTMLRKIALIYDHTDQKDWELLHAELDGRIAILAELLQVEPIKLNLKENKDGTV
jgi:hypothetical protein